MVLMLIAIMITRFLVVCMNMTGSEADEAMQRADEEEDKISGIMASIYNNM